MNEELKAGSQAALGTGTRARRLRDAIAIAEIAVSLALLVGAGLLLRSFDKMRHTEIGVDTQNILTVGINLPATAYESPVAGRAFFDRLLDRVRSTPGIQAASISTLIPLEGGSNGYITVPGRDDNALRNQLVEWNYVTPDYFRAYGIRRLQGRNFTSQDENQTAEVSRKVTEVFSSPNPQTETLKGLSQTAIVNRAMARLVWPNQDPIGKIFRRGSGIDIRVVGVVADVKSWGIREDFMPQAYSPFSAALGGGVHATLAVRTSTPPMSLLAPIRAHVNALDPSLALVKPRTMDDVISDGMAGTRLQTWLIGVFAALAVVLAAVGLYSVMAFLVAQRRQEIGIRLALGAGRSDLLRLVLGHAAKLIAVGVFTSLGAALWLTRLIKGVLFGVAANALLTLIALVACAVPARRAMAVDAIVALRYE